MFFFTFVNSKLVNLNLPKKNMLEERPQSRFYRKYQEIEFSLKPSVLQLIYCEVAFFL